MRGSRFDTLRFLNEYQEQHGALPPISTITLKRGYSAVYDLVYLKREGLLSSQEVTEKGKTIVRNGRNWARRTRTVVFK